MSFQDSPLQAAKDRLPIPVLWQLLKLPGKPGRTCFCPFHENTKTEAGSVFEHGGETLFKCHAGCTDKAVDSPGFLALHLGTSNEDACRKLIEMAGVLPHPNERKPLANPVRSHGRDDTERKAKRKIWPRFDCPTDAELESIAALRGLTVAGINFAALDGLLRCADSREGRAWIITDCTRRNAQGRLMSGQPWVVGMKSKVKAKTLPGAEASWPIGLPVLHPAFSCVALCEGGPDLLAAYDMARRLGLQDVIAPVAMLGASNRIPDQALRHLAGKRVRIFVHDDEAGEKAVARWGQQLIEAGIEADGYLFEGLMQADGKPVKDLNDFMRMSPEQIEKHARDAFAFAMANPCGASIAESITTPAPAQAAA
jgi:hypothetical protein